MKILVVDDSKAMRMIVRRSLVQGPIGGLEITEAASGIEALAAIEADVPDLVLSDWNLPEMNGIELLRELRSRGCAVRFGFITSESQVHVKDEALDAGAMFVIVKPFTAEDVNSMLLRVT